MRELLTVREVAEILQIHPNTVRLKIQTGKIKAVKLGPRSIRVWRKDLDNYINNGG